MKSAPTAGLVVAKLHFMTIDAISAVVGRPLTKELGASLEHLGAAVAFALAALLLFVTAPHNGEFWYSDAPRHALNGVFIKDLFASLPADPKSWAMEYYVQYPALTIL